MAELSPELIEKLAAALESVAERLGKSTDKIEAELYKSAALEKNRVAKQQADSGQLKQTLDQLKNEYKQGTLKAKEYNEEIEKLKETTGRLPDSFKDLKKEVDQASAKVTFSFDSIKDNAGKLVTGFGSATAGLARTTMDVFKQAQSGASGFQMAGSVMSAGIDVAGKGLESAGSAASAAGQAVSGLGRAGKVAGLALQGIGAVVGTIGKASPLAKQGFDLLVNQLEIVNKSYDTVISSGALFADAMTGMKNTAKDLNLTQAELANVVSQNKEVFATTGLGVEGAAKKMGMVSKAAPDLAGKLFNLGLSAQEQVEVQARVMADMNRAGTLANASNKDVAAQTESYAKNLRLISAITGEDAKARQDQARKQMNNLGLQAKIMEMRARGDEKGAQRMENIIATAPKGFEKLTEEILANGQVVSREGAELMGLLGSTGANFQASILGLANDASKSGDEVTAAMQDVRKNVREDIARSPEQLKTLGTIAQQGGPLAGAVGQITEAFADTAKNTGQSGAQLKDSVDKMATTTDEFTKNIKESTEAAQKFKVTIDQQLTEGAAKLAGIFPTVLNGMTDFVNSLISAASTIGKATSGLSGGSLTSGLAAAGGVALAGATAYGAYKGLSGGGPGPGTPGGGTPTGPAGPTSPGGGAPSGLTAEGTPRTSGVPKIPAGGASAATAAEGAAAKNVAGTALKAGGKSLGKLLPGVGLILSAVDAYERVQSGDFVGAAMAGAGGLASLIPVIGTAASAALNTALVVKDVAGAIEPEVTPMTPGAEKNVTAPATPITPAAPTPAKPEKMSLSDTDIDKMSGPAVEMKKAIENLSAEQMKTMGAMPSGTTLNQFADRLTRIEQDQNTLTLQKLTQQMDELLYATKNIVANTERTARGVA